jgi:hypothetical protein
MYAKTMVTIVSESKKSKITLTGVLPNKEKTPNKNKEAYTFFTTAVVHQVTVRTKPARIIL